MSAPAWGDLEALFHEALERAPAERAAFLTERCGGRRDLQTEVEALLRAHEGAASAFVVPPLTRQTRLKAGVRLGPYEVLAELGTGGMGEVYRARDPKLGRDVAIKVLPALFLSDPERRARFEREARVLAALNHPNIAVIHGIEDAGGAPALVLELVEGLTLAERLARPIPVTEALAIARQIAEALEAAHDKGIIHRDLKPANIKITSAGVVKVLDFGLAKVSAGNGAGPDLSQSPTVTAGGTRDGMILGTPAYMSPEQTRGQAVDKRADIWAFGCVLYEMVTGRTAFAGDTVSDTIAAILDREVNWGALPQETPSSIRRLLQRCLTKDPKRRLRDTADARLDIDEALSSGSADALIAPRSQSDSPGAPAIRRGRKALLQDARVAWGVAACLLLMVAALAVGSLLYLRRAPADPYAYRSSILPPAGVSLSTAPGPNGRFALSPDARRLAFVALEAGGATRLWMQLLDGRSAQPLAGTEDADLQQPFWSPDSRLIGFFAGGKVRRIDAAGGPPLTLVDNPNSTSGAAWNREDVVLFATFGAGNPIRRVSASGGTPSPVTTLDVNNGETRHAFPFFLPDGRHFLYLAVGSKTAGPNSPNGIYVTTLDSKERKLLVPGGSNAMYAQGYLFFLREQTLMAQPFDVERLELTGNAAPIAERVIVGGQTGAAGGFTVSQSGVLAYQTGPAEVGGVAETLTQLVWFDRSGKQTGVLGDPARFADLSLAPDGRRVAVSIFDLARRARDIWLFDIARGLGTRFTFDQADELASVWSPDGSRVVFNARRKGHLDLYQKASNGAGTEEELLADGLDKYPNDWSPDGRFILFVVVNAQKTGFDLWVLPLFGDRKPFPFIQTQFNEVLGQFSPDGRWIAYVSNESGREEVYVAPFYGSAPDAAAARGASGGKWLVSTAGGSGPRWRRDGKEIFYWAGSAFNKLMAAEVNGQGSAFEVGAVRPLFDTRPRWPRWVYDVSPDGQRFLVNTLVEEAESTPITLVINWPALLKK